MDDTFQVYINRVARLTLPESHCSQLQHIQSSPKYRLGADGVAQPMPFPGFSIISPPRIEDPENSEFYDQLRDLQQLLMQLLPEGLLVPLPPETFHMTLADLIWDSAYRDAAKNAGFDAKLRDRIAKIFEDCRRTMPPTASVYWQVLGLGIRTRAISACLAPKDEASYEQVLALRRAIFQNSDLMALGIEQQYHLTAHVTLGYFGAVPDVLDREGLSDKLNNLSLDWLARKGSHSIWLHRAEFRKFDDMTRYYREPDWPALEL